ncbi:zinc-binding alcohol dehydrogenase family protein [Siccirubricoccus sp. G192]|uniref:zinc-binding alcohol dehydrogenase family protein n=1 Tax=Siccirubricoccus sp. G192 TaxID=2849651 RepID=UPI001C2B9CFF|nr:zinc-binding alcohol dehydrogenase family protein [Siccirubricoccus sp. G192]MBV1796294.1 zinc-binding alcohol dehydrogenase family protein [Siccirubricoccus sp. G192]
MKAVGYTKNHPIDHPEALLDLDLPEPGAPRGRDLLVEVRAVSVNPVDTKQRRGLDPGGKPRVLGFDAAGVVRAAGPDCTLFRPGDAVFHAGLVTRPGSNAELQLVDERIVGRKPATLSFAEAAALPLTSITAWEALFERLRIPRDPAPRPGEAVLLLGGGGGVASIAIQLARQLTGLTVLATASRPETREWCLSLGAHHVLDHAGDLPAQVKALGLAVPHVFGMNHTEKHWDAICALLAPQGLVCAIDEAPGLDMAKLKRKSAGLVWEGMFARALFQTPDMIEQHRLLNEVSHLVDAGTLRHTMTTHLGRLDAASLRRAHALVESGGMRGKLVLDGFG